MAGWNFLGQIDPNSGNITTICSFDENLGLSEDSSAYDSDTGRYFVNLVLGNGQNFVYIFDIPNNSTQVTSELNQKTSKNKKVFFC
jgi:hypothetical protein